MGGRSYSKRIQLSSSTPPMETTTNYTNPNPNLDQDTHLSGAYIRNLVKHLTTSSTSSSSSSPPPTPPKSHKKQVRRRLHTTKPYQERLLNMAEARKEIVTALKFHRANMKKQQQQQQQQQPPPFTQEFALPSQTLGLNLNSFQDLTNLDAACIYSVADDNTTSVLPPTDVAITSPNPPTSRALGDLEMEEIKSIGERHEIEWNDTLNFANSAWWFKFLNNVEFQEELSPSGVYNDGQMELPVCWEGNYDPNFHANDASDGGYYQSRHLELPCMNIEDIEGLDEEWLS